jgi:hypothetical protein
VPGCIFHSLKQKLVVSHDETAAADADECCSCCCCALLLTEHKYTYSKDKLCKGCTWGPSLASVDSVLQGAQQEHCCSKNGCYSCTSLMVADQPASSQRVCLLVAFTIMHEGDS